MNVLVCLLKNLVGVGDLMIAGFIGVYSWIKDLIEVFKWGVVCGSVMVFFDDLVDCELIDELLLEVEIIKID